MRAFPLTLAGMALAAVGVLAFIGAPALAMSCCASSGGAANQRQHGAATDAAPAQVAANPSCAASVTAAIASIDAATKALESGDHAAAARELANAKKLLEAVQKQAASASAAPAGFVNTKCPIMGSPINPSNVTAGLTRVHKGKKVAFCCGGCPAKWDRLTDAEKNAKLK
ncbi:MAG: hypothetical protein IMZ69_01910 [Spirochaetes bacterium]|nr:hypothetical protein [Spirochaetota bacterium]